MGTIPYFGGTQRLTHLIGKTKALELMMTGKPVTAAAASTLGMINYVVSNQATLVERGRALLHTIMGHAPLAVGMLINCANAVYNPQEDGYQAEANSFAHCCKTEDLREGIAALLEARTPLFKGS